MQERLFSPQCDVKIRMFSWHRVRTLPLLTSRKTLYTEFPAKIAALRTLVRPDGRTRFKEHQRDVKFSTNVTRLNTELLYLTWTTGHAFHFTAATTLAKEDSSGQRKLLSHGSSEVMRQCATRTVAPSRKPTWTFSINSWGYAD